MIVRRVSPEETADLRRVVLRGGRPVALPGDTEPAFHLGAYDGDTLIGTGNIRPEPAPWASDRPGWRVRGMATDPAYRSRGAGTLVLSGLVAYCRSHGGGLVWFNARTPAQGFYERAGFAVRGDPWVDPEIGPHVSMWAEISA